MYKEINGQVLKDHLLKTLQLRCSEIERIYGRRPGLAVILVGENAASQAYVGMKKKACAQIGIHSFEYLLSPDQGEESLLHLLDELNSKQEVDGILLQLPLPKGFDEQKMLEAILPEKDVDGFHPVNVGRLLLGLPCLRACTPYGVMKLLEHYAIQTEGKHVVILGRSNIVGKPLAAMLMQRTNPGNATVTICHSKSENLKDITLSADILIAAIGQAHFVREDMVKTGAVVIDVGINRVEDFSIEKGYRLVGDVDFTSVSKQASLITPVPGGVGPMTIAMLMENTVQAFLAKQEK